jgi:hypothetical protein
VNTESVELALYFNNNNTIHGYKKYFTLFQFYRVWTEAETLKNREITILSILTGKNG